MSISQNDLQALVQGGGNVLSSSGDKIGGIGQVYLDDATGEPSWVTAKTGLFGASESFVPLSGGSVRGDDVVVDYDKDKVKDAPQVEADGSITPEEEEELYRYYGLSGQGSDTDRNDLSAGRSDVDAGRGADVGRGDREDVDTGRDADLGRAAGLGRGDRSDVDAGRDADVGRGDRSDVDAGRDADVGRGDRHDATADRGDNTVTRSEEELNVGTRKEEVGKARLRKYVVTENVTTTVPVEREEVRLEREPIAPGEGAADAGADLGEEDVEVTLTEEVPVVEKERVAKEKVRLAKDTVTDEQEVSEEVKKEQIDTDVDGDRGLGDDRGRDAR